MTVEAELRALEQQLLQDAYEERSELRDKIVQQSHKLLEAAESVQSLSHCAGELLKTLNEIKVAIISPLKVEHDQNDTSCLEEDQKIWLIEMLLAEGCVNCAMLIDLNSQIIGKWLKCHINQDSLEYLTLLAINSRSSTLEDLLTNDINFEVSSKQLIDILNQLRDLKQHVIVPEDTAILPLILNINLEPKTIVFDLTASNDHLKTYVLQRETEMAQELIKSVNICADNATLVEVLLRADKEFDDSLPELVHFVLKRIDDLQSTNEMLQLISQFPRKYQLECSSVVLRRLENCHDAITMDPYLFSDERLRQALLSIQVDLLERSLVHRLEHQKCPIEVLLDAEVPKDYKIKADSQLWKHIQVSCMEEDLISMRLLIGCFIPNSSIDAKSPNRHRFDILPSPDSIPHIAKIPVKRQEKPVIPAQIPSPTSPTQLAPTNSSASTGAASTIKQALDPLQALKKILPY